MIMLNFFFFFLFSFFHQINSSNPLKNTSWKYENNGIKEVRIYSDNFFSSTIYNDKIFISTYGGKYLLNEDGYYEVVEFNSLDSSLVGDSVYFSNVSINYNKKLIIDYLVGNKISFVDYLPNNFLIIILEQNNILDNLLSKDNNFYKYLTTTNKDDSDNFF